MRLILAEIHNKISRNGNNLSDRLEDQLTGDFFGPIRYMSFEKGLKPILTKTKFFNAIGSFQWSESTLFKINFWVRSDYGEIDVLVETDNEIIGIEVKYLSNLSSDDEVDFNIQDRDSFRSIQQLYRYSEFLNNFLVAKKKILILIAPIDMGLIIARDTMSRGLINENVCFGFLSWQDILATLIELSQSKLNDYSTYEKIIIKLIGSENNEHY